MAATASMLAGWVATAASGQLRVVTWNISNYGGGRTGELQTAIYGVNPDSGLSMEPDVIIGQEFISASAVDDFRDLLNGAPGSPGDWVAAPFFNGPDTDSAFLYRDDRTDLLGVTVVSPGGLPPQHPRHLMRYDVRPAGYTGPGATIACYSTHMKAGIGADDLARRFVEAEAARTDAQALPGEWHFLIAGDLNMQTSAENAYQELVGYGTDGTGRFFDPISTSGSWNNNIGYRFVHSQDPAGPGGMDDRFDQILVSGGLRDGEGMDYVGNHGVPFSNLTWNDPDHSYRTWGNDGSSFNSSLTVAGNSMVGPDIAQALIDSAIGAGHLPVLVEIRVPPKVFSEPALDFGEVPQGSNPILMLNVSNAGDTDLWGIDGIAELEYTLTPSPGLFVQPGPFADAPGGPGNEHVVILITAEIGPVFETLTIDSNAPDEPQRTVYVVGEIVSACPADLDGDGEVGIEDFLIALGAWGTPGGDTDGDGDTDIQDFLAILGGWGPCP